PLSEGDSSPTYRWVLPFTRFKVGVFSSVFDKNPCFLISSLLSSLINHSSLTGYLFFLMFGNVINFLMFFFGIRFTFFIMFTFICFIVFFIFIIYFVIL